MSTTNETYRANNLTLSFTADKPTSWIGYSLDGKENLTIAGNTTLTALANGPHNLTIYANDSVGNMGASGTIHFSIDMPSKTEQSNARLITVEVGVPASAAVMAILLFVVFRKRRA